MQKTLTIPVLVLLLFLSLTSCTRHWKNPETSIPATKMKIKTLLVNPIAYDNAGVVLKGKVWDVNWKKAVRGKPKQEVLYTLFVLADVDGNHVGVVAPGHINVLEGDIAEVTGYYRTRIKNDIYDLKNTVEAVNVKVLKRR